VFYAQCKFLAIALSHSSTKIYLIYSYQSFKRALGLKQAIRRYDWRTALLFIPGLDPEPNIYQKVDPNGYAPFSQVCRTCVLLIELRAHILRPSN